MTASDTGGPKSFDEISRLLPYAYPMLLVDQVLSIEYGKRIVTRKAVTGGEPYFRGHFAGGPSIVPGALITESISQSALLLAILSQLVDVEKTVTFVTEVRTIFKGAVRPGDRMEIEVTLEDRFRNSVVYDGIARLDGRMVARSRQTAVGLAVGAPDLR